MRAEEGAKFAALQRCRAEKKELEAEVKRLQELAEAYKELLMAERELNDGDAGENGEDETRLNAACERVRKVER